jgi:hypothetical protein
VIGDVGGHLDSLRAELTRIGVPDNGAGAIPADLVVVQVGDLVHRGPESAGVVALVDGHLRRTPDRWLQLIGNHEAYHVFGPQFRLRERLHRRAANTLRSWWREGLLRAGVAFDSGTEHFLVTHAGLTREYWRLFLGGPATPSEAADALNDMLRRADERLIRTGQIHGGPADFAAGPLWAAAGTELVGSWRDHHLPFSQIHGHSGLVEWPAATPAPGVAAEEVMVDHDLRHTTIELNGGRIIGVDPGHYDQARESWGAWQMPLDALGDKP